VRNTTAPRGPEDVGYDGTIQDPATFGNRLAETACPSTELTTGASIGDNEVVFDIVDAWRSPCCVLDIL